jgi:hypothetical protein
MKRSRISLNSITNLGKIVKDAKLFGFMNNTIYNKYRIDMIVADNVIAGVIHIVKDSFTFKYSNPKYDGDALVELSNIESYQHPKSMNKLFYMLILMLIVILITLPLSIFLFMLIVVSGLFYISKTNSIDCTIKYKINGDDYGFILYRFKSGNDRDMFVKYLKYSGVSHAYINYSSIESVKTIINDNKEILNKDILK